MKRRILGAMAAAAIGVVMTAPAASAQTNAICQDTTVIFRPSPSVNVGLPYFCSCLTPLVLTQPVTGGVVITVSTGCVSQ